MREGLLAGIDVGGTNIKLMLMTTEKIVLEKRSIPTKYEEGYYAIADRMIKTIEEMRESAGRTGEKILSVGMGLPGTVDSKNQTTVCLSKLHWDGFNPAEKIGKHFDAAVRIENDANLNTLGEYAFGKIRKENMVLITLGTGLGGGVIIEGKLFGGNNNMAAELGHMVITADDGPICLCGRRGHLEAYCSGTALGRDALEMMKWNAGTILHEYMKEAEGVYNNSMITRGVKAGDKICCDLWNRFVHYLSAGLTNIMNFYNPEVILIGGGISNASELLLEPLNRMCKEMVIHERSWCPVEKATLGSEAGMYGACALAALAVEQ